MKITKLSRLVFGLFAAAGIALAATSCSDSHDHDHDDHDHEHGDHDHDDDHADGDESASAAADDYPLKVCVVSGEPLGSMGDPVLVKHEGVTVKLCCDGCIDEFNTKPAEFAAKLTVAN